MIIVRLVEPLGDWPKDVRDRALLLMGSAGASSSPSMSPTSPRSQRLRQHHNAFAVEGQHHDLHRRR